MGQEQFSLSKEEQLEIWNAIMMVALTAVRYGEASGGEEGESCQQLLANIDKLASLWTEAFGTVPVMVEKLETMPGSKWEMKDLPKRPSKSE
jgi:hypothetical protein